ncbi:MAG: alpha-L-fucosidase, partial [Verrucomicrobiota bacterium]|nr:alpha-L-fucosidase [Verrucomicrobiota bacterium]MEC7235561.1 alpha-L-fucosidase [Verrucomicrobiota bacterium]
MYSQKILPLALLIALSNVGCNSVSGSNDVKYEATIESLRQYDCPDWFRDAKFGIYLHWGAYSV